MIRLQGTTFFRRAALIVSAVLATLTMFILLGDSSVCPGANLKLGLWLTFSVQATTFFMLLFHFIGLGWILRKLGRILGIYYFYLVGAMIVTQIIFFQSDNCYKSSPLMYLWIILQIVVFYVFVAYGIALWGAYICWESEKEEKEIKEAMKKYVKKMAKQEKENQLMLQMQKKFQQQLAVKAKKDDTQDEDEEK